MTEVTEKQQYSPKSLVFRTLYRPAYQSGYHIFSTKHGA